MEHNNLTRPAIVIEGNIPFARGLFDNVARVSYLSPAEITPEVMKEADALMTRTRVRCDRRLLEGSRCRIVASATIGLDHVDTDWCREAGIEVKNAPGCNAPAVAQYVMASILSAYPVEKLPSLTLGIIGVGHVGSIVQRWAKGLGMMVLACDPPRQRAEGPDGFCSLDEIARKADIITVHTPFTKEGPDTTLHLLGADFLNKVERQPMIINSARGPIADTAAVIEALDNGKISRAVIDCWEGEPDISPKLLEKAWIATPHIAGYSRQGKIRATAMAADAIADALGLSHPTLSEPMPAYAPDTVTAAEITESYDPMADTRALRSAPSDFEKLRNTYHLRDEVNASQS